MSGGRFRVESVQSDEKPSQGSQDEALTTSITSLPPPPPNGRPTAGPAHGASAAVLAKWSKGWCGAPPKSPPLCRSMSLQHFVEPLTDSPAEDHPAFHLLFLDLQPVFASRSKIMSR
ncbi:hypothetical protein WR25_19608 [Diploscapter pachys]|uniref:Uncharacterized protein n=1 Tax=Diploscapter pachys TaxID=2018661 RepID=A0A2A2KU23_9BILA|nr:hypothetical protein WR25_19608 [Diploscapter pachys]